MDAKIFNQEFPEIFNALERLLPGAPPFLILLLLTIQWVPHPSLLLRRVGLHTVRRTTPNLFPNERRRIRSEKAIRARPRITQGKQSPNDIQDAAP
jgi:hypothetical protein